MREPFPLRRLDTADLEREDDLREDLTDKGEFVVTATHVSQTWTEWGRARHVALPLHLVSSVVFRFHAPVWRLVVAVVLLIGAAAIWLKVLTPAFSLRDEWTVAAIAATVIGGLGLLSYFVGRRQVLVVESSSHRLVLERRGADDGALMGVAEKIVERQAALLRRGADRSASQAS